MEKQMASGNGEKNTGEQQLTWEEKKQIKRLDNLARGRQVRALQLQQKKLDQLAQAMDTILPDTLETVGDANRKRKISLEALQDEDEVKAPMKKPRVTPERQRETQEPRVEENGAATSTLSTRAVQGAVQFASSVLTLALVSMASAAIFEISGKIFHPAELPGVPPKPHDINAGMYHGNSMFK